jgi:toxin ParE1/3/4
MTYRVEISRQADADLRSIYEYIAFTLRSPENAIGQINRLEDYIMALEDMPERFRKYAKEPWHSRGMHRMPVDNYLVFYIPDRDTGIVAITRVMYAGRDVSGQLAEYTEQ